MTLVSEGKPLRRLAMTSKAGEVVWDAVHVGLLFAERGIARDGAHNGTGRPGKGFRGARAGGLAGAAEGR